MDSSRDEARLLADVMAHANLTHRLGWIGDVPVAAFRAASPACEEGCDFFVDLPGGWLRVTTSLPLVGEPSHELLVRLARIQLDGGSGQGAFDRGQVRLSVSLPGLQPPGSWCRRSSGHSANWPPARESPSVINAGVASASIMTGCEDM